MTTKKTTTAPQARYAEKQVTPLIQDFAAWLTEQTGYKVDPLSVYLGSALRGEFQKSEANQVRLAEQVARVAADKVARAERRAAREAEATEPKPALVQKATTKAVPAVPAPVRRRPLKVEVDA